MLFEINRDFPFQVALSFDDAAMEVLEWLDDASFEWDMYVDLPENCIPLLLSHRRRCDGVQAAIRKADLQRRAVRSDVDRAWLYPPFAKMPIHFCP